MSEQAPDTNNSFITSDIGIAAYLQLRGYKLVKCFRQSTGKFHFEFEDLEDQCRQCSIEFLESDFCKFDNNVRNLKKILFS